MPFTPTLRYCSDPPRGIVAISEGWTWTDPETSISTSPGRGSLKNKPMGMNKASRSSTRGILGSKETNWYPSWRLMRLIRPPISYSSNP